jgi:pyruvate ferredoxin oxidoreductase delta subunit
MAKYEPQEVDITICVDDTLCKGVESWAWYGLQPVNKLLKPGGTLIVTSLQSAETLIGMAHRKDQAYKLAIVKGTPSFSGLWVFKDDHTDVRILGAVAKLLPELFGLQSVQKIIVKEWKDQVKAESAARSHERITTVTVQPDQGNPETPYKFTLPKWHEMGEGIAIPSIPAGHGFEDPSTHASGGFRPERNPTFKKFTTRTMRPVVTPDNLYDANMQACCGCGVCEAVCPVKECVTMVNETEFSDNSSQWESWRKDKETYKIWLADKIKGHGERSHGFRYRGQYEEQVPEMLQIAREG